MEVKLYKKQIFKKFVQLNKFGFDLFLNLILFPQVEPYYGTEYYVDKIQEVYLNYLYTESSVSTIIYNTWKHGRFSACMKI